MKKINYEDILALIPTYSDSFGDATLLYYPQGKKDLVAEKLPTVLQDFANHYFIDYKAMQRYFRQKGLSGAIPLYLGGEIYICCKARKPKIPRDPSYGYYSYSALKEIGQEPSFIYPDFRLPLACSLTTAQKSFHNAVLVEKIISNHSRFH